MIANWMESTYVSLPLINLKVSVSDFSVYNSTVMLFLTLYLLLCERRENREIGRLFQDVHAGRFRVGQACYLPTTVYRAVMAFMIFNLAQKNDDPIKSIISDEEKEIRRPVVGNIIKVFTVHVYRKLSDIYNKKFYNRQIRQARELVYASFFLPLISIVANAAYHIIFIRSTEFPWGVKRLTLMEFPVLGWEFICMLYVAYLTWKILKFHYYTKKLVDAFKEYSAREAWAANSVGGAGI